MTARIPIRTVAPTAEGAGWPAAADWPGAPPKPLERAPQPPLFRPLKIYAFGPSHGLARGNIRTIHVRYEKLAPGPIGDRIAVVDYDASRNCYYDPVDLDNPMIAINGGLDPSESNPQFHQQMVYAVASECLRRVEIALGRTVEQRSPNSSSPLRLAIYPHGEEMDNAYGIHDTPVHKVIFGYFRASENAVGRTVPGQTIFTCLSHDLIVHSAVHAVFMALRPDLSAGTGDVPIDNVSLQEALADGTSLLFHFNNREAVLDTIHRTAGVIYRSQLDAGRGSTDTPRILAELVSNNPLLALSQDFGEAVGLAGGIRNAILAPDPKAFESIDEVHERGAIVVSAVFDAMFSVYQRRSAELFRISRAGGALVTSDIPEPLASRLAEEIERIANRVFNMCWRALDYCPAASLGLGDFLRAGITADFEYTREDAWGLRDALMHAFRLRGIKPTDCAFFTEDGLRWPVVDEVTLAQPRIDPSKPDLRAFVEVNAKAFGFTKKTELEIYPLEVTRLAAPDDSPKTMLCTQVLNSAQRTSGIALVFDGTGRLRYAIPSSPTKAMVVTTTER